MPRVREVAMDGLVLKISPFSYDEVENYVREGHEMVAREPKPGMEEWAARTLNTVVFALNKAANGTGDKWTPKKLTAELDMPMIHQIHKEFLEMSGLGIAPKGEADAASTSR